MQNTNKSNSKEDIEGIEIVNFGISIHLGVTKGIGVTPSCCSRNQRCPNIE